MPRPYYLSIPSHKRQGGKESIPKERTTCKGGPPKFWINIPIRKIILKIKKIKNKKKKLFFGFFPPSKLWAISSQIKKIFFKGKKEKMIDLLNSNIQDF